MLISFIRAIILYLSVITCVRIMGKRQIGQLQPSELVITILISEVAAIPMQDKSVPLINAFIPLLILVSLEILISAISLKSGKFRNVIQGNSIIIIRNGVIDQKEIKRLRYSVEDILEELRKKNVFDIQEVLYAIAETDGSISIMLKANDQPLTAKKINIELPEDEIQINIVDDGNILTNKFKDCNMTLKKLHNTLEKNKIELDDVLLMTSTESGKYNILKKDRYI